MEARASVTQSTESVGGCLVVGSTASQRAFRLSVGRRETPRAMAVTCACFVSITVTNAMFGPQMAAVSVLLNSIVGIILLGSALVIRRADLPAAAPPWIAAGCAVVMVVAGQIQVWLKPDAASFVYIMLIMVASAPAR